MPRLDYFVVAQGISVDQSTNSLSIFNVLEELRSPGFPILIPMLSAISVWIPEAEDDGRDFQCILRVTLPGEESRDIAHNFVIGRTRHRLIQRLQGVPIQRAGEIRMQLLLNGATMHDYVVPAIQDDSVPTSNVSSIPA